MRCLMPGARPSVKPLSAGESSGSSSSDEVSHLELQSQRQLEEDVASDAYTECNIKKQEKEIIDYLNENLISGGNVENNSKNKLEEKDELEVYSTPNCVSPEEKNHQKTLSSSPSKELTKEYYALVPLDGNVLDKELIEQDALSNAFQSINNSQFGDIKLKQNIQCVKPTSLCLNSSHVPKIKKHSNSCDILKKSDSNSDSIKKAIGFDEKKIEANKSSAACNKSSKLPETSADKVLDPTYTPDSLITDEPSSSSDYLSAAYAVSPGTVFSSGFSQINVGEHATKMDNIVTITDSGLESSGMLESLNSHKDVTLTDVSLTESHLHDLNNDDNNYQESASNALVKNHVQTLQRSTSLNSATSGTSTGKDFNERKSTKSLFVEINSSSSKEEKQRQNEEIVILESSSLSSETGSWESVFPPKLPDKELCERFINSERKCALELETKTNPHNSSNVLHEIHDHLRSSLVQKSPFKSASCFIDAASLADEGDDVLYVQTETKYTNTSTTTDMVDKSLPIPCTLKRDLSPNDWSGSNDNEDSLEQADNKDSDSIQKDLSLTIFEMELKSEDSSYWNACDATDTDGQNYTHYPILAANSFIQIHSNTQGSTVAHEINRPTQATQDPFLAGNGEIQIRSNLQGSTVAHEINRPTQATQDPFLARNGEIQIRSNLQGSTVAHEISRPMQATQDPFLAGNGEIQIRSNLQGSTDAHEINRPTQATQDPFLAGNGEIQIHSNLQGSTVAHEINRPMQATQDPFLAGNGEIQIHSNLQGSTVAHEITRPMQVTQDPFLAGNGEIQIRSNSQGSAVAVDQIYHKTTHDPLVASNSSILSSTLRYALTTPNNSIVSVRSHDLNMYGERQNDSSGILNLHLDNDADISVNLSLTSEFNDLSLYDTSKSSSLVNKREIENIPIVSGAYLPEPEDTPERPPKAPSTSSFWVVDMASSPKSDISECSVKANKPIDQPKDELRSASKSTNSSESYKSRCSVESDSSDKSTHKFYIDLATLPDALTPEQNQDKDEGNEKKNIFSMFIGLGEKSSSAKEMPVRFSSPNSAKKAPTENNSSFKVSKTSKPCDSKTTSCATTSSHYTDESILFEKLESLCADPSISISLIKYNIPLNEECPDLPEVTNIKRKDNDLKNKVIQEEAATEEPLDLFVKLSDLDKPAPKVERAAYTVRRESHERMTRSIPDNNWRESSQTINLRSGDIISSFHSENALSLNRLFPHLKNDFSRSMPGSLSSRTRSPLRLGMSSSPGDIEECQASDVSEMSSVQSSFCRSVVENSTTEETEQTSSLITNCQSRLGQDLLRMFLEEIAPDVIVEVSGRRIKAHKCILSSRCQYFAGILSGGWVESAGNVISLPPFSFSVVHFALCHIYSGVSVIPDSISIVELATLADMLGLEGLKEGIMFLLKAKYCHHFHKPCPLCTAGVLECLPLATVYGLDDLFRKCLRWITKHFHRVWPTKAFATLPIDLIEKCCQELIVNLTVDNFVETVFGCGIVVSSLAPSRWAGVVEKMCRRLVKATAHFAAKHLCEVLHALSREPAQAPPPALNALQECIAAAIEWSPPQQTCRAYRLLYDLLTELRAHKLHPRPDLIAGPLSSSLITANASAWRLLCEGALVRNAPRVVPTAAFAQLPAEQRDRLRDLGCIVYAASPAGAARATRRPRAAPARAASPPADMDRVRACFVPYSPKPPRLGSVDSLTARDRLAHDLNRTVTTTACSRPRDDRSASKMNKTFPPCVRTTKAQEERAKYNSIKSNMPAERAAVRAPRVAYEHAKPRYMEPRQPREKPPAPPPAPAHAPAVVASGSRKPHPRMVSSSDSSRNSSPVLRGARARSSRDSLPAPAPAHAPPPRPRTADISTDSLKADKYATYTKAKHNTEGSVEAVQTPARSQAAAAPGTSRSHGAAPTAKGQPSKTKTTKIPVYLNKIPKSSVSAPIKERRVQGDKPTNSTLSPNLQRNKPNERKPSGSLMNATKSSQAKMVSKTVKETTPTKHASKQDRTPEPSTSRCKSEAPRSPSAEIPVMERSGTFLKDEPMFGDKTTDIDVDE